MKQTIRIVGLALTLALGAVSAQANEIKPYAGVGIGLFTTDFGYGVDTPNEIGYFVRGGVDFHEFIGAELRFGAVTSGTPELNGVASAGDTSKVDWFVSYLLKPKATLGSNLEIYGLVGATTAKVTVNAPGLGIVRNSTKTMVSFGGGLQYGFNDMISAGVEYVQYTNKADVLQDKAKVSGFAATLNASF